VALKASEYRRHIKRLPPQSISGFLIGIAGTGNLLANTDDDLSQNNGRRDQLEGKIQQRYALAKDLVRKDVDDWLNARP
jgi:uncharacterized protein YjbJ (UPF0337 family)